MSITPAGQAPSSVLAALELQYAIAAKTLQTANANAQAALQLLADAVAFSQDVAQGAADHTGTGLNESA